MRRRQLQTVIAAQKVADMEVHLLGEQ